MRAKPGQPTIGGLLLANIVIAAMGTLLTSACDGVYSSSDSNTKKLAAGVTVIFGLPAVLAWIRATSGRDGAFRVGLGLHCTQTAWPSAPVAILYGVGAVLALRPAPRPGSRGVAAAILTSSARDAPPASAPGPAGR